MPCHGSHSRQPHIRLLWAYLPVTYAHMGHSILNPYVAFGGTCREAMTFYQSVLGGDLVMSTVGETMGTDSTAIMHAKLEFDGMTLMGSDDNEENKVIVGNNVSLSLSGDDEASLTKAFNGLSEGGTVSLPLAKQIWGDMFGMFTDKFGMHWMVNINAPKAA